MDKLHAVVTLSKGNIPINIEGLGFLTEIGHCELVVFNGGCEIVTSHGSGWWTSSLFDPANDRIFISTAAVVHLLAFAKPE